MKTIDLFGELSEPQEAKNLSKYQRFRKFYNYQKSEDKEKSCKNCNHLLRKTFHGKNYSKCNLQGDSNANSSDIILNNVCNQFKKKQQ